MQDLIGQVRGLDLRRKLLLGGGAAAVIGIAALGLSLSFDQGEALLFAGLDPKTAGEVATALDGEGIPYEVRGERIYVPAGQRDRLRLVLAERNLPGAVGQGYELLDGLDGFATTSEMFNVTYWRAKEGELARTLLAMSNVTAARVHIGAEERSPFGRRVARRTASVTLTIAGALTPEQLRAVRHLTALSVPGLLPEDVAVIDAQRGLLTADDADMLGGSAAGERIEAALLGLLEARLGRGNARVEVALDSVRRREEIASSTVDPERTAILSRSREENKRSDQGTAGAVTIASDLPDGETDEEATGRSDESSREDVTYAVSTTNRTIELMPGGIERLSVAVLVNEEALGDDAARASELDALRALVAAAAGLREERGDLLTLEAMVFGSAGADAPQGTPAAAPPSTLPSWVPALGVGLAALLVAAVLLRTVKGRKKDGAVLGELTLEAAAMPPSLSHALPAEDRAEPALPAPAADPVATLREQSAKRPDDAAALLNAWLNDKEAAA